MALEAATYIHQLDASNPPGTDQIRQADDHLRLIKAAIKATFPNITGPVTASQTTLNTPQGVPVGIISIWYGNAGSVPSGYTICNGATVALSDGSGTIVTPDLRNLVVMGAGGLAAQGTAFGASTVTSTSTAAGGHTHVIGGGDHTHNVTVAPYALTIADMPAHQHGSGITPDNTGNPYPNGSNAGSGTPVQKAAGGGGNPTPNTLSVGGGTPHGHAGSTADTASHVHTISTFADHQHQTQVSLYQPALALHYIMRV